MSEDIQRQVDTSSAGFKEGVGGWAEFHRGLQELESRY
jgi:hypothetical protein